MKDDIDLPPAFHAAGQRPGLVRHTLEIVKGQMKGIRLAGNVDDAMRSLEECDKKVKILQDMFEQIALQPQTSRRARYLAAVR
ncbi:hypothetical protein BGZ61DRAFT_464288 [Ilyonectria robusta]|uniref:uncharacterized protein n=1 Tax=Ilyonectria robusta TaxID=1079257 RepID=UPI001E8CD312|nr:uncharacterized protein BGZ61DRAFT_464288 [Ilyonectria robusta]KAH8661170.1 hypothetical protein BGZ61DRAFT_464288 [Ilyonectria robusta]